MKKAKLLFSICLLLLFFSSVFGEDASYSPNLALTAQGATVSCSSFGSYKNPKTGVSYSASCDQAIDGVAYKEGINTMNNTFWGASNKKLPSWLEITLAKPVSVSKIVVKQLSVELVYYIEVSEDEKTWREVVPSFIQKGPSTKTHEFKPEQAKFVRLTVTGVDYPDDWDEDVWAVALWEVGVYEK